VRLWALAGLAAVLLLAGPAAARQAVSLGPAGASTVGLAWRGARAGAHPPLIVVLHGDAPQGPPSYQYRFAENAAAARPDAVVLALLRPGYADPAGRRSGGRRGWTTGDNYTPEVLDQLAGAILEARRRYAASDVVLVGHSGGAALAALLLERRPWVADAGVLVACPCDLHVWRRHMARLQLNPVWLLPVQSLSPIETVGRIRPGTPVTVIVGARDDVAPPTLSRAFVAAGRRKGVAMRYVELPGKGHEILLDPAVFAALK
jgi:dipeptidyl aminopeptidase/acylaminoacyl peptidase